MTAARAAKLDALGFAWELSAVAISKQRSKGCRDNAGWQAHLAKLRKYKRAHGDCNVPQGWAEDKLLGGWVKNQREYKKKLDRGEPSVGMTAARVAKLEALGFAWKPAAAAKERPAALVEAAPSRSKETATRAPARAAEHVAAAAGRDQPAEVGPSAVTRHPPGAQKKRPAKRALAPAAKRHSKQTGQTPLGFAAVKQEPTSVDDAPFNTASMLGSHNGVAIKLEPPELKQRPLPLEDRQRLAAMVRPGYSLEYGFHTCDDGDSTSGGGALSWIAGSAVKPIGKRGVSKGQGRRLVVGAF